VIDVAATRGFSEEVEKIAASPGRFKRVMKPEKFKRMHRPERFKRLDKRVKERG
jgi:hypothetical protein